MRTYDLTPFYRSTVGFDRLFSLLDRTTADGSPGGSVSRSTGSGLHEGDMGGGKRRSRGR